MKKLNIWFILIGLLCMIVPFFINIYSIFRLISLLIGIIILSLGLIINFSGKIWRIVFLPIVLISISYLIDYFSVNLFSTYPIISMSIKSSSKVTTYNSLFYRVFNCNGIYRVDNNYEMDYICNDDAIEKISINKFLENPKQSYHDYKNKFVHLEGKITTIVGNSSLTLASFEEVNNVNGYVTFDEDKKVIIDNLKIDPTNFYIYDYIEVIGLVSSYSLKDGISIVHLTNAKIIPSSIYNEFELSVNNINSKEKVQIKDKIYYIGIEGIYYRYDENNIYELSYLLLDKRENLENLVNKVEPETQEDDSEVYLLENYTLVKCKNDDLIFLNKNLEVPENVCKMK